MAKVKDMTVGSPAKLIVAFAIPMLLGNLFQQLYSMVDSIVVGRVEGVEALAAVGSAGWLDWLVLGIVIGVAQGFSILVSQRFGAEDYEGMRKAAAMSVLLSVVMVAGMMVLALTAAYPILRLMNTPENIIGLAYRYIRILFCGIPVIVSYNLLSAFLRALGDSRTPLIAMVIASLINIGLDVLFVAGFGWSVEGVAGATVTAQFFSFLYCLLAIRRLSILKPHKEEWRPDRRVIGHLIRLGLPMAFQNAIISAGGLILQFIVNGFGYTFVAGFSAAQKLCGLMEQAGTSFGSALGTFAGQNLGAQKYDRIRAGVRKSIFIVICIAVVVAGIMLVFGKNIMRLFVTGEAAVVDQVIQVGYDYLTVMSIMLFSLYLLFAYRSTLQGMGDTMTPMWSGVVELIMRITAAFILPRFLGETGVYIAEVSAWVGAAVLLGAVYYKKMWYLCPASGGKKQESVSA